jgi:hypothetical protein
MLLFTTGVAAAAARDVNHHIHRIMLCHNIIRASRLWVLKLAVHAMR